MAKIKPRAVLCAILAVVILLFPLFGFKAEAETYKTVLSDLDNCLTEAEEDAISAKLVEVSQKVGINIGIVITAELLNSNGHHISHEVYSENFCNENFGEYSDSIVLLLFNSHDKPEYTYAQDDMYMYGKADELYYERSQKIWDRIYDALLSHNVKSDLPSEPNVYKDYSSASYYIGCMNFCNALERYGDPANAFWIGVQEFIVEHIGMLFIGLIIGAIVAFVIFTNTKRSYSKKAPISAAQYIDKNRKNIVGSEDRFIREYTTSHRIDTSSSSGGRSGGGGHSGGGGGHHSGGHHR